MSDGYTSFNVKQLFAMVDAAKQTLGQSHEQIAAWRRAHQMLDQHGTALKGFVDQLTAKWPPETNAASAAYLTELNRLVQAVDATAQSAISNATHIGFAAKAIEDAHATVQPLHQEYLDNEKKLAKYQATLDAIGTSVNATSGPVAGFLAKGATELFTSPPVDDGRQEALQRQVRAAMTSLAGAARDSYINMLAPPTYIPPQVNGGIYDVQRLDSEPSGRASRPPIINPPAHTQVQPDSSQAAGAGSASSPGSGAVGAGESSGGGTASTGPGGSVGSGPALSGVITPAPPHAVAPGVTPPTTMPVAGGGPVGGPALPLAPGLPGAMPGGQPVIGGTGSKGPLRPFGAGSGYQQPSVRSLPSGGVIGGQPGVPAASPGRPGGPVGQIGTNRPVAANGPGAMHGTPGGAVQGRPGARQVNPLGGVIGQQPAAPSGPGRPGGTATPGMLGGQRGSQRRDGQQQHWDPDNTWAVAGGVEPVIEPGAATDVDPGPGIIGMQR